MAQEHGLVVGCHSVLPPMPHDATDFGVSVRQYFNGVRVEATLLHCGRPIFFPFEPRDFSRYVSEPNVIMRMLGETLEKRIRRARIAVSKAAERELAKYSRIKAAIERSAQ